MSRWRIPLPAGLLLLVLVYVLAYGSAHTTQAQTGPRCFSETNQCIEGRIRQYWEQNGGLPVFGYPISPQIAENVEGTSRQVQWFERNRLELHPEKPAPYDVLLGRLGDAVLKQQGYEWHAFPKSMPQPGCQFFADTGHNVCEPFLTAWRNAGVPLAGQFGGVEAGSLALIGLPISSAIEPGGEGNPYAVRVQWFERARFEYHLANPPQFQVLLGLLGNEARQLTPDTDVETAGRIAFTRAQTDRQFVHLCILNADASGCSNQLQLTGSTANEGQPTWSPDGTQVAFESDVGDNWEIYRINANHTDPTRLTESNAVDGAPSWGNLPGRGWQIAFHSNRDNGVFNIYLVDSRDGDRRGVQQLTDDPANDRYPAIAPDGRRLAFASNRGGGNARIFVADLVIENNRVSLANITSLTNGLEGESRKPDWSPDGTRLAFENIRNGQSAIYVVNADGSGGLQDLTGHSAFNGHPAWSPDGTRIAFHTNRSGSNFEIWVMNNDGSNAALLIREEQTDIVHPAWSVLPPAHTQE